MLEHSVFQRMYYSGPSLKYSLHLGSSGSELIFGSRVLGAVVLAHPHASQGSQHGSARSNWN